MHQEAEGRKQEVCDVIKRQEAGGRRQEAGGRRQEAGGRRQEVYDVMDQFYPPLVVPRTQRLKDLEATVTRVTRVTRVTSP